jgi:hypothetical protein
VLLALVLANQVAEVLAGWPSYPDATRCATYARIESGRAIFMVPVLIELTVGMLTTVVNLRTCRRDLKMAVKQALPGTLAEGWLQAGALARGTHPVSQPAASESRSSKIFLCLRLGRHEP